MKISVLPLLFLVIATLCAPKTTTAAEPAKPLDSAILHNVFQIGGLYSGNGPEGEAAFRELQKMGVKTIISVDGSKPNLELARKFGMRYIHLPIAYDGVPKSRALELTKAVQTYTAAGPIYLHCHHGKHRGPAAVAAICRGTKGWSADEADEFLKQAGTSPDYKGLFRDVRAYGAPGAEELAAIPNTFPEIAPTPALVDGMVTLDEHHDSLKAAQKTGWKEVPGHPGLTPDQPAVLAWELLRELARDPEAKKRGDGYAKLHADSEQAADLLRKLLRDPASDTAARDTALQNFSKTCGACHKAHRN
jgi:protein tyrosine phosphatase (PTP) superfamily phosphohydrolase (DUF442 family)